jgi:hypothetical protein
LPGFDSFAITALAGFSDGRFAALVYFDCIHYFR